MKNVALDPTSLLDTMPQPCERQDCETELDPQFFQQIPNGLFNDLARKRLKPIDVSVYAVLKKHQGEREYCWAGNSTIARLCGTSVATVRRSIKSLVRAGHIERRNNDKGLAARTYFPTAVVNGKSVYGVLPVLPRQSCKTKAAVEPLNTPAPTIAAATPPDSRPQPEIDADHEAWRDEPLVEQYEAETFGRATP